jgi:hypothetical protein
VQSRTCAIEGQRHDKDYTGSQWVACFDGKEVLYAVPVCVLSQSSNPTLRLPNTRDMLATGSGELYRSSI